ncbi:hypothetical protein MUK42_34162 [Musa troglodytarum]|uniref:Uncharacterized protein n=1 Tax=Musa troglodytarum TaxID=320322 RepID=A0A9E7JTS9_9LILI|nr:hypothetical protein MUK42_34162 [Musa troglodytarum]
MESTDVAAFASTKALRVIESGKRERHLVAIVDSCYCYKFVVSDSPETARQEKEALSWITRVALISGDVLCRGG